MFAGWNTAVVLCLCWQPVCRLTGVLTEEVERRRPGFDNHVNPNSDQTPSVSRPTPVGPSLVYKIVHDIARLGFGEGTNEVYRWTLNTNQQAETMEPDLLTKMSICISLRLEHSARIVDFLLRLCVRFALIPPLLHPTFFSSLPNPHARSPGGDGGWYYPDPGRR